MGSTHVLCDEGSMSSLLNPGSFIVKHYGNPNQASKEFWGTNSDGGILKSIFAPVSPLIERLCRRRVKEVNFSHQFCVSSMTWSVVTTGPKLAP